MKRFLHLSLIAAAFAVVLASCSNAPTAGNTSNNKPAATSTATESNSLAKIVRLGPAFDKLVSADATKEITRPNGIALSPDEKRLYVASSDRDKAIWMVYDARPDGTIANGKVFFDATPWAKEKRPGLPDGMKVDKDGNLFATGPGGVLVFSPEGKHLGTFDTGVPTANVACFSTDLIRPY